MTEYTPEFGLDEVPVARNLADGIDEFANENIPNYGEIDLAQVDEKRVVLKKFEGDYTDAEIDAGLAGTPVEELVIVDGVLVERYVNGEQVDINGTEGGN
jgi:hypothetical protein